MERHSGGDRVRRATLHRVVVVLAIVACGLAIAEIVARRLHADATRGAILESIERQRYLWKRPDAEFHHAGDGIFSLRFPAPGHDPRQRVLIVGDSFVMGHGVGEDARFGALLEESLGDAVAVDVLATASYSPIIYRNIVARALSNARYAVVAVFVDQTDPADDLVYRNDLVAGENSHRFDVALMEERDRIVGETYDRIAGELSGWRGLARRSAAVNLLVPPETLLEAYPADDRHVRYVELSLARWDLVRLFAESPAHEATKAMEDLVMGHVVEIVDRCDAEAVPVVLAANPWQYQVTASDEGFTENRLESLLGARFGDRPGVLVLPLTDAFRRHPNPPSLFLHGGEIHWSREGHVEVERVLRAALRERLEASPLP